MFTDTVHDQIISLNLSAICCTCALWYRIQETVITTRLPAPDKSFYFMILLSAQHVRMRLDSLGNITSGAGGSIWRDHREGGRSCIKDCENIKGEHLFRNLGGGGIEEFQALIQKIYCQAQNVSVSPWPPLLQHAWPSSVRVPPIAHEQLKQRIQYICGNKEDRHPHTMPADMNCTELDRTLE